MRWAIVYTDRSVFTSDDGPPEMAPRTGVQLVIVSDAHHGWVFEESSDPGAWVWRDDEGVWFGVDEMGLWDYRFHYPGRPLVLYGERLTDERWHEVRRWANEHVVRKHTWSSREVRRG